MTTPIISAQDLARTYEGKVPTYALKGVTFDIEEGAFVAIMGRSGSGKSTLLHQLGLLDTPTFGTLKILGRDVLALSEDEKTTYRLKHMGHIFQEYALITELNALENVFLPALALPGDHDRERARELLNLVDMGGRLDHYPHELSGGEQQRVAIARSLINNPAVVFADEPTANLDTQSARTVLELFRRLNRELKQTIVMVTHEPDDKKYVDCVMWLTDGLIERVEEIPQHGTSTKGTHKKKDEE